MTNAEHLALHLAETRAQRGIKAVIDDLAQGVGIDLKTVDAAIEAKVFELFNKPPAA
mgnify:CR=1 FL=1